MGVSEGCMKEGREKGSGGIGREGKRRSMESGHSVLSRSGSDRGCVIEREGNLYVCLKVCFCVCEDVYK